MKTKRFSDNQNFQLKHLTVQPVHQRPILVVSNQRLLKLAVDNVVTKNQEDVDILFIATEHNTIQKYTVIKPAGADSFELGPPKVPTVCLLEETEVIDPILKKPPNSINNFVLVNDLSAIEKPSSRFILITTSFNVIKIPIANCQSQTNYFSCLSMLDPYCIWDSKAQRCLLIFKTNETIGNNELPNINRIQSVNQRIKTNTFLHQYSINTCPNTKVPVDGGFSEWSQWASCMSKSGQRCKCRMRVCNSPEPKNGGKNCDENAAIEVLECEVHGGWTSWSAWSGCRAGSGFNCDSAMNLQFATRSRFRTCTNPEPKFNGRICVGLDQEEEVCTPEMVNPCLNSNQWLSWGPWEECSKTCGEGFQMRRRVCNGKSCVGCNQEWRTCNSDPCKGNTN